MLTEEKIVVIGASAGGVEALLSFVPSIGPDFPAPLFVVLHIPAEIPSLLASILQRKTKARVEEAVDGTRWENGVIYVAAPDRHLVLEDGRIRATRGPRENRHRPAIDPLFRSAALQFGPRVIAVVLTGSLDDGTGGAITVKHRGGTVIVQDPQEATYASMPATALEYVDVDAVVRIDDLAATLKRLIAMPPIDQRLVPDDNLSLEIGMAKLDSKALEEEKRPGRPSAYSCPDCGGVLWEIDDAGEYTRFRCRVGHAFSPESMISAQSEQLEEALWSAVKTLEETVRLSHRLAAAERQRGHQWMAERFEEKEREAAARVETIRRVLIRVDTVPVEGAEEREAMRGAE
jgi:two-component system chemotaxis response regulator CheB